MNTEHPQHDHRSPEEVLKAQRMMVIIFAVATLMPTLWMVLMAWNGIILGQDDGAGGQTLTTIMTYWGLAGPVVWLTANAFALFKLQKGDSDGAKLYPLIPAFWAILWFAAQVTG